MKIGILTFHFGNNYGGILQCYALQQILKSLGHDVEIINYKPIEKSFTKKVFNKLKTVYSLRVFLQLIIDYIIKKRHQSYNPENLSVDKKNILKEFDRFRDEYLNITKNVNENNIADMTMKYEAIIVGSDQVWTSLYDKYPIYFLDWIPGFKGKKISYAACSAHHSVQGNRARYLKKILSEFELITVRDHTTANLIKQITGKTPDIVADPTCLYSFDEFISKAESREPYILTYILGSEIPGGHAAVLQKIKSSYGEMKVISILIPGGENTIELYSDEVYKDISPEKWVDLFSKATFVYTDSFHGVMFSTKFKKQFLAYYANTIRASRLIDLKERFNLKDVIVDSVDNVVLGKFSYAEIEELLSKYNTFSKKLLLSISDKNV